MTSAFLGLELSNTVHGHSQFLAHPAGTAATITEVHVSTEQFCQRLETVLFELVFA